MNKFKKLVCAACATLFCLSISRNVLAEKPKVEIRNYTNYTEDEGIWLSLISPKGKSFLDICCLTRSNVPYNMNTTLLPLCIELLNKCKDHSIPVYNKIDISTEKYRELTKICQTILGKGRRKPDQATKENEFKKLILTIFEIYNVI